jgi:hypothetical protein
LLKQFDPAPLFSVLGPTPRCVVGEFKVSYRGLVIECLLVDQLEPVGQVDGFGFIGDDSLGTACEKYDLEQEASKHGF